MVPLSRRWYSRDRAGTPVLLLHGLGSRGEDWALQAAALSPTFPVLTVDLRGHGDSATAEDWPTIADMAADVNGVLRAEKVSEVHLVGLSLGAAVGLQLALDHSGSVKSLTLVNGFAQLGLGWHGRGRALARFVLLLLGRMDWLGRWVARSVFPEPDQYEMRRMAAARLAANDRGGYLRALWALRGFDVRDRIDEVQMPTLLVAGTADRTVPFKLKQELAKGIPGAELVTLSGSGHATPLDAPQRFNQILLSFLEQVEGLKSQSRS